MKFKNHEIETLGKLLYELGLKGKDSRMRTRFVTLIDNHLKSTINEETRTLVNQYAEKDVDGSIVLIDNNENQFKLAEETAEEFHREYATLMNEDFHIEENEANKMMILTVAEIMLEGDFEVSGDDAVLYDQWCEKFESVVNEYREDV